MNNIEVEIRGLLSEENYNLLMNYLDKNSSSKEEDNRRTVFFIISGKTLKVTDQISKNKAKVALKIGDIVKDSSQTEYELSILPEQYQIATDMFINLGFDKIQHTEQKRINYVYKDVEIALKWSEDWGFHFEIDKMVDFEGGVTETRQHLLNIATDLGLEVMSEDEFGRRCDEIDKRYNP